LKDPLFLIQLLALIIISLAIAAPFIMAMRMLGGINVIILDASAVCRPTAAFTKAVEEQKIFLSARNTIILAESIPVMIIQDAPASSASG